MRGRRCRSCTLRTVCRLRLPIVSLPCAAIISRCRAFVRAAAPYEMGSGGGLPVGEAVFPGTVGGGRVQRRRCLGSRASLRPSPTRFKDTTARKIARPGKTVIHQARVMKVRPVAAMVPQDAVGGRIPKPRKLSPDSARIAPPIPRENATMMVETTLGNTPVSMMRQSPAQWTGRP